MKTLRLAVAAFVLALALAACGDDSGDGDATGQPSGECDYPPRGDAARPVDPPPADPVSVDAMTISTNRGDIRVTLDPTGAPCTVNSFVSLARQGYFDDTKCIRLVVGFVLQCGDPTETRMGGPGYGFADELSGAETYSAGTFAMANSGEDTNGSQFFIVLHDSQLDPLYTVFGTVDAAGLDVALAIEAEGNGPDGESPAQDVVITSVK